jgi:hypothetical protein
VQINMWKKMGVFWVAAPCSLVHVSCWFRGTCCLHHQSDESANFYQTRGATAQKTSIFIRTIVRTWNPTTGMNIYTYHLGIGRSYVADFKLRPSVFHWKAGWEDLRRALMTVRNNSERCCPECLQSNSVR